MRFSDLGKKKTPQRTVPPAAKDANTPAAKFRLPLRQAETPDGKKPPETTKTEFPARPGTQPDANPQKIFRQQYPEAKELYGRLLGAAREIIIQAEQPRLEKHKKITRLCSLSAAALEKNLPLLNCAGFSTAGDYLYAHTANVTVFSQAMALELALSPGDISLLSFCAMSHDLGMSGFGELYRKEELLTDTEFSLVASHAEAGAERLDHITDIDCRLRERAKKIVYQTHERFDGHGYPRGLSGDKIDFLAQIIGLADVYEAMTHPRTWREAMHPNAAIKKLIGREGGGFNPKTVKALVNALSIYPPSSLVALSGGEIVQVLKSRRDSFTRPLVEIILDADFAPVRPRIADLSESPLTAIERPVAFTELEQKNPEFAAGFEMSRWWVEW